MNKNTNSFHFLILTLIILILAFASFLRPAKIKGATIAGNIGSFEIIAPFGNTAGSPGSNKVLIYQPIGVNVNNQIELVYFSGSANIPVFRMIWNNSSNNYDLVYAPTNETVLNSVNYYYVSIYINLNYSVTNKKEFGVFVYAADTRTTNNNITFSSVLTGGRILEITALENTDNIVYNSLSSIWQYTNYGSVVDVPTINSIFNYYFYNSSNFNRLQQSYTNGYNAGFTAGSSIDPNDYVPVSNVVAVVQVVINAIQAFLDIKIGTVSLGAIVLIPFSISVAWFIIKQFRGGGD